MADQAALMASLPTHCTPMPMKPDVVAYLIVDVVLATVMTAIICGRIYVRIAGPGLSWDDYITLFAYLTAMIMLGIQGGMSACGLGYDISEGTINLLITLRFVFAAQLVVIFCAASVKISILLFYLRVFTGPILRKTVWVLLGSIGAWTLAFALTVIFTCTPVEFQWNPAVGGTCLAQTTMFMGLVYSNFIFDIIVMAVPIPTVLGLQMKLSDKIGLIGCLFIGLVAATCSAVRGAYVKNINISENITGTIAPSVFLSVLDPILSVACVSIPTLRPLWRRWSGHSTDGSAGYAVGSGHLSNGSGGRSRNVGISSITRSRVQDRTSVELENISQDDLNDDTGSEKDLTGSKQGIKAETSWAVDYAPA